MSRSTLPAIFVALLVLFPVASSAGQVPQLISYQGQLNDQSGTPVDATVSIQFSIYDTDVGGTALWTETQSVQVSNGLFSVQLGSVETLPPALFFEDLLYLGIRVGADQEMTPRQQITSTAYSLRSDRITPPGLSGAKTISLFVGDNGATFTWSTVGTVPSGAKWLITAVEIIHESGAYTGTMGTAVRVAGVELLGMATRLGTDKLKRTLGLSWPYDVAPVLTAGQTAEVGAAVDGPRLRGAILHYIEVPESFETRNVLVLSTARGSDGTYTLGTVPSGKTWRVVSMAINTAQGDYVGDYRFGILLNGVRALYGGGNGADSFGGESDAVTFPYEQAPTLEAGEEITFHLSHNLSSRAYVVVVEE